MTYVHGSHISSACIQVQHGRTSNRNTIPLSLQSDLTTVSPFPEDEALTVLTHLYIPMHEYMLGLFLLVALLAVQL